jgi:hypothetical protein
MEDGMNEMTDRVALAIFAAANEEGGGYGEYCTRDMANAAAKAAIEAMREPPSGVAVQGHRVLEGLIQNIEHRPVALLVWHAMIDAALKQPIYDGMRHD